MTIEYLIWIIIWIVQKFMRLMAAFKVVWGFAPKNEVVYDLNDIELNLT